VAPGSSVRPSDPRPPTFLRLRDRAPRPPLRRRSWKSRVGTADLGKWLTERRNLAEDYRKIYGAAPDNPGFVSIAIDSDDTSSSAESFFGSILFKKP